ncbi:MAG: ATP-dependent DNA ligase [Candidatus Kariarchaeaceae archaeon]
MGTIKGENKIKLENIPVITLEKTENWDRVTQLINRDYNVHELTINDYLYISNHYHIPLHILYLITHSLRKNEVLDQNSLASSSFYAICRDVLTPYKNKSFIFRRYFNIKYPYLRNTDDRLKWFLRIKNGLKLSQKVSLLESETNLTSMGIGKTRFEQALQRVYLAVTHEDVEKRRLLEYDGEWALTIASYVEKERGDLTAAEVLLTADALSEETKSSISVAVLSYLLSRMGKIEVYFVAVQVKKFHDQISRTSSLVRAFADVFETDVKMLERLVSMHSMTDVAWLIENDQPLVEFQRLLPFRTFRPMLAAKWDKKYKFPTVAEAKYDGIRLLIHKSGNRIQCFSRRRKNYTYKFSSVTNLRDVIPAFSVILDGEIVGIKMSMTGPRYANVYEMNDAINQNQGNIVFRYVIFDVLYLNGFELTKMPYGSRRQIRHQIAKSIQTAIQQKGTPLGMEIQEVETVDVISKDQLIRAYNNFLDTGCEGAIIKNLDGIYEMGKRSRLWYKLKPKETLDVAITGIIPLQTGTGIQVWGVRYAIKREAQFVNIGMIRGINQERGIRLAELLVLNGLLPQQMKLVDLGQSIEHLGRFSGMHEKMGVEVDPQIVITIDSLGIVKKDDRFSLRNARFLYIREDKPVDEISTYYDLYDYYMSNT